MSSYPPKAPENGANFTSVLHEDTYPAIYPLKSDLSNRSVFITGAAKGIGRATALSFAKAGASSIALADITSFENIEQEISNVVKIAIIKTLPKLLLLKLDVRDPDSVRNAVEQVKNTFGYLDILVNNAGFMAPSLPVASSDDLTYWETFEVNIKGVYLVTRAFLPLLLLRQESLKTIVNLNSVAAHNLRLHASAYGTTKLAILRFTEFLMVEEAHSGLLAYCVQPGAIMTKLAEAMEPSTHAALTHKPEMAADTIVFLTQEKREWLAGRYISCTWDMPQFLAKEAEIVEGDKLKVRLVV